MKPKIQKIKWCDSLEASKWPKGSVILQIDFRGGEPYWHSLKKHLCHRPDWITPGYDNYIKCLTKSKYCLLSLPE